jgi:hypothetical protein
MRQRHPPVPREILPDLVTRRALAVLGIRDLDVLANVIRDGTLRQS